MLISKKDKYLLKKDSFICVHNTIYQINCYISSQIKETMNIHIDNNFDTRYYLTEIDKTPTSIFCYHKEISEAYVVEHKHNKAQFLYCEGGIVYVKIRFICQQDITCGFRRTQNIVYTLIHQK